RQTGSGSIEGLVWLLGRELTRMGHEATVFAAAGSQTCGELVATLPGTYGSDGAPDDWQRRHGRAASDRGRGEAATDLSAPRRGRTPRPQGGAADGSASAAGCGAVPARLRGLDATA